MSFNQADIEAGKTFLAHHGVKGMHWGVERSRSALEKHGSGASSSADRAKQLKSVNKKIGKINGEKAFKGYELRGWALKKQYKKAVKKNPNFSYGKLTEEQKAEYQRKASRKVTRSVAERGAVEVAAVLAAGIGGVHATSLKQESKYGADVSVILLAGQVGKTRVSQLQAIRTASKLDKLHAQRSALGGAPK